MPKIFTLYVVEHKKGGSCQPPRNALLAYHDAEGFSTAGIYPTAIPDDVRAIDDAAILTFLLHFGVVFGHP